TGKPKGVIQNHRTILARERGSAEYLEMTNLDVSVNWLPLEHVVGLLMFHIQQLYLGCMQVQIRKEHFLTDPLVMLDMISKYKATNTFAPNFAYSLVNRQLEISEGGNWDLSSMRIADVGAEAINAGTMKKFLKLLQPYKLSPTAVVPSWGMSETSSGVTYSKIFSLDGNDGIHVLAKNAIGGPVPPGDENENADSITYVEVGRPFPGVSIRIVDTSGQVVEEGTIGRLHIKGETITPGYYDNPEINKEVFTADEWFDTGDLAFIYNGGLTITGRAKDVIIINGINYSNNDIETLVEELENIEISYTAACAVRDTHSVDEKLAIFYCTKHTGKPAILEQVKEIRRTIAQKAGIDPGSIIPVKKEEIPKTAIGKLQRSKLVQAFEAGQFYQALKEIEIGLGNENTVPSWFFREQWQPRSHPAYKRENTGNTTLLFEDETGMSRELVRELERNKNRCIKVKHGSQYQETGNDTYEINYNDEEHYKRLLRRITGDGTKIDEIVHLAQYNHKKEKTTDRKGSTEKVKEANKKGNYSILHLIKALEREKEQHHKGKIRLMVVTSNSRYVTGNESGETTKTGEIHHTAAPGEKGEKRKPLEYEKSTLHGYMKCLALEYPWLESSTIDLEPGTQTKDAQHIIKEYNNPHNHPEVAYRKEKRYIRSLARLEMKKETAAQIPVKKGGVYIVTGGLGGLGTIVCKWLTEK
ncbi:MAG: AMP-binding protein, partial [bacterium]|nr:AMP-binding protein [bacterium]